MLIADLYIRVSTDEQADKGYSLRYQEEVLRRYCDFKSITVRFVYVEDHSAKSFNRPEWKKLMLNLHKHKNASQLLLFTKWDRFSRNTTDAYMTIASLNKLGVEPQAIEQPLDVSVPENKMMLAIYLAQPEVENHRRSLNIYGGMRRAKKEGRYLGFAPPGYRNKNSDGKKWIEIDPIQGPIMKWVFEKMESGIFSVPSVLQMAVKKGLKTKHGYAIGKTCFWNALRNPVYCGKIKIPSYKNEPGELIQGKHQPLISEALFYRVQDVLDGKKKLCRAKIKVDDNFPLRGFLICTHCGKLLTASTSKGRSSYYSYYHCFAGCNVRHSSQVVNEEFKKELSKWKPDSAFAEVYKLFLADVYEQGDKDRQKVIRLIREEIMKLQDRLKKNRKFLLDEKIAPDDYMAEKMECEKEIVILEDRLSGLTSNIDLQEQIDQAYGLLNRVDEAWEINTIEWKREFVGSMFPEKLVFSENHFRTAPVNEAARLIYNMGAAFSEIKMGQIRSISEMSYYVELQGFEP